MRILLATTRNISQPTGEWRLISERASGLQANSVPTDVLYVHKKRRSGFDPSLHVWAGTFFSVSFRTVPGFAAALIKAASYIRHWLRQNPDGYVLLSGLQLHPLTTVLPHSRIIIDNHGTPEEWIELRHPNPKQRALRYLYPVAKWLDRLAFKRCSGTLVASQPQHKYVLSNGAPRAWLVPCVLSSRTAQAFSAADRWASRKRHGIESDTTAVVYCGGFSEWQCVRDAVNLFRQIRPYLGANARLIMITPSVELAVQAAQDVGVDDAIAVTLPPTEVAGALVACDIGLMLREATITNHCAFPNKFAEYVAAGLYVISSPGLTDPAAVIQEYELGTLITPEEVRKGVAPERLSAVADQFHRSRNRDGRWRQSRRLLESTLSMEACISRFVSDLNNQPVQLATPARQ